MKNSESYLDLVKDKNTCRASPLNIHQNPVTLISPTITTLILNDFGINH